MAYKEELPPLLAQGLHRLSISEMGELCVDGFPLSKSRAEIMAGFRKVYDEAVRLGFRGEAWIDGSFLTKKIDPADIDFIFVVPAEFYDAGTKEQVAFLDWLICKEDEPKKLYRCHTDLVLTYKAGHPSHDEYLAMLKHWEVNVYGFSVKTKEPKGIAVVELGGGLP